MNWMFPLLVLTGVCGTAGTSPNALAFEFVQGVIVNIAGSVIYMMNSEGGIDAVNMSSGEVIATSTRGTKPLLLFDDVLLAQAKYQANLLRLVALTTKDLTPKFETDLLLSPQVRGGSFYVRAGLDADTITVRWRSVQHSVSGMPSSEPGRVTAGFALIDPKTGHLITAGKGEPPVPPTSPVEIPPVVQKLVDEGALASPLCRVNNLIAALQYDQDNGAKNVTLRRWNNDTGEGMPNVSLFGGELTFRGFSRDCRNLLASKAEYGWTWHIYSVIDGRQIAEIHNMLPGPAFFVSGGNLIYEAPALGETISGRIRVEPPRLVALDLSSGKEMWVRPVGGAISLGPIPGNF